MKTKGMAHQLEALKRSAGRTYFALFMEQGTGKTWTLLAEAEKEFLNGNIDALLVIAPNGVHRNWVRREIPTHLSVPFVAATWRAGNGSQKTKEMESILKPVEPRALMVLSINVDALITKPGMSLVSRFCSRYRVMCAIDESSRIKNPTSARSKAIMTLRDRIKIRRIASGTPVTNSPIDIFSQMNFLSEGLLGTNSFRVFTATYAEIMPPHHPLVVAIAKSNPRAANAQMIAKNADGSPRWKNLDKLKALIQPHSFRVLKKDCLDLPPKIYKTHSFELTTSQRKAYAYMADECRVQLDADGESIASDILFGGEADPGVLTFKQQAVLMKLHQISSGFVKLPDGNIHYIEKENGRLEALSQIVEEVEGNPGYYTSKFFLRPHYQLEGLTVSLRLVSKLPSAKG